MVKVKQLLYQNKVVKQERKLPIKYTTPTLFCHLAVFYEYSLHSKPIEISKAYVFIVSMNTNTVSVVNFIDITYDNLCFCSHRSYDICLTLNILLISSSYFNCNEPSEN